MDAFDESFTTKTEEVHGKHHIPLSDALARLESMLEAMNEEGQTRALQRGNWGWTDGSSNGWFSRQLFDDEYIETDNAESYDSSATLQDKHYDFWFRIIEYNK